jgi:TM2 domain-containing membrane protein YozV
MKNKTTAWLLALLLLGLWIHKFYLWSPWLWILYLIFCFTLIPAIIALFESLYIFSHTTENFNKRYNKDYKECSNCWEYVLRKAIICKHCNNKVWE